MWLHKVHALDLRAVVSLEPPELPTYTLTRAPLELRLLGPVVGGLSSSQPAFAMEDADFDSGEDASQLSDGEGEEDEASSSTVAVRLALAPQQPPPPSESH
ncbi:hypothetical protein T492DRAFT_884372 [Pavlovales sp. CCMP2436]|nr:hypothetical protein T492DRAFT_884372 [Pavlovales sp. CCMP2436]